jgi:hypothetical protein
LTLSLIILSWSFFLFECVNGGWEKKF